MLEKLVMLCYANYLYDLGDSWRKHLIGISFFWGSTSQGKIQEKNERNHHIFHIFCLHASSVSGAWHFLPYPRSTLGIYTASSRLLCGTGNAVRALALRVHCPERFAASQLSTVWSAWAAQGTDAHWTKAWIIEEWGRHCPRPTSQAASFHTALSICLNHRKRCRSEKPATMR
jgi:hypothetical protein